MDFPPPIGLNDLDRIFIMQMLHRHETACSGCATRYCTVQDVDMLRTVFKRDRPSQPGGYPLPLWTVTPIIPHPPR